MFDNGTCILANEIIELLIYLALQLVLVGKFVTGIL